LSAGKYIFKVIAANADGVWNQVGQSFTVTVLAPFYKRWWFLSLMTALFALTITGFSHYRVAQHRRAREAQHAFSQQLIASQEGERKRIAGDLHDSLYNLRPYHLDRLGLSKAIEGLAESVERGSGIDISVLVDDIDEVFSEELRIMYTGSCRKAFRTQ
jgi:signal transduction histidine kinase